MSSTITRRRVLRAGASALAVAAAGRALAQGLPKMRFSSAFTEQDPRADAYKAFAAAMKNDFEFQPFWGNTLFKQGTELVALQRGNLEMANLAPQDISKQLPAWSLLTSAYLFRDVAHLKKTFNSDVGRDFIKMARDELPLPKLLRRQIPIVLSPDEVKRMIDATSNLRHRTILMTLYSTGMRRSELCHLRTEDIDKERMVIRIRQGKGGKDRELPLSPKLYEQLRTYYRSVRRRNGWLFPSLQKRRPDQPAEAVRDGGE